MDYAERQALFRAHAAAVLTGDAREAERTHRMIFPEHFLAHHVFLFALFTVCVVEHFGEELDWGELDAFTERLRRSAPEVSPLKTEALIRVCYGESRLYLEVPQAEHWPSMWAVCRLALDGRTGERELTELFDLADGSGREMVRDAFASEALRGWPAPEPEEEP